MELTFICSHDQRPIAGGRELWGFPKKLAAADAAGLKSIRWSVPWIMDRFGLPPARWATNTAKPICCTSEFARGAELSSQDHSARRRYATYLRTGRISSRRCHDQGRVDRAAALHLSPHALAPVADLPVLEVVSAIHILADLTLGLGKVVHDYLQQPSPTSHPGPRDEVWPAEHEGMQPTKTGE